MADRRRKTQARRKPVRPRTSKRNTGLPGPKVRAAFLAEYERFMEGIEVEIDACIRARRWGDLETAITGYARALHLDPTFVMHSAIIRGLFRHALTLTAPHLMAEYARHIQTGIELADSGMPLAAAIAQFRTSVEHRDAFRAFDAIPTVSSPTGVH